MSNAKPLEIIAGSGQTLGANYDGEGVNFALFSARNRAFRSAGIYP